MKNLKGTGRKSRFASSWSEKVMLKKKNDNMHKRIFSWTMEPLFLQTHDSMIEDSHYFTEQNLLVLLLK